MMTIESIPALTGSEKQIAWATDIREAMISTFERLAAMPAEALGVTTEADKYAMIGVAMLGLTPEEKDAVHEQIMACEDGMPSVSRRDPDRKAKQAARLRTVYDCVLALAAKGFQRVTAASTWIDYKKNR